ncbi:MAG: hypothetical protein IPK61_07510 [Saprospiraceae bacterium]|nr:hypothetical protein [Saprospiraceae bacterium]
MKNLAIVLFVSLLIVSCKNNEQFRAPIDALAADWEKSTGNVAEIGNLISGLQSNLTSMKDSFVVDPKLKLTPTATATIDSLKNTYMASLNNVEGLTKGYSEFSTKWTDLTGKMNSLKEGLAANKLEGDVMAQINELKNSVAEATTMTEGYKSKLEMIRANSMSVYQSFKAALMPAKK